MVNIMTGKTIAILLSAGDTVYLVPNNNVPLYSDDYYMMSFAGFLYEPLNSHKVIWSVHRSTNIAGQYSPFPFTDVSVNVGNGWNKTTNIFLVPQAGVYHLHLTASSKEAGGAIDYRLMWNGVAFVSILGATKIYNGINARSRSVMIEASVGDTFYIATTSTTSLQSGYRDISFTGYLVAV